MTDGASRLLAVGPDAFAADVVRALPSFDVTASPTLLDGLWTVGQGSFDAVVVYASEGRRTRRLIESMRQVRPTTRVVVAVRPPDEPLARQLIRAGAHEYVLEPIQSRELEQALGRARLPLADDDESVGPSHREILHLSEVLRSLPDGADATLRRLASMVCDACEARGAAIDVRGVFAQHGEIGEIVLAEPIRRGEDVVGRIALGPRRRGAYSSLHAGRLATYARLVDTIAEQVRDREHWRDLALRDEPTGVRNARYFDEQLDAALERSAAARRGLSVLLVDVDELRSYNERHGRGAGDTALRELADLLSRCTRERDIVARLRGDTFAILLSDDAPPRITGSSPPADAAAFARRFDAVLCSAAFSRLGPQAAAPLTASIGLATFPWDGRTRDELMRAADESLRQCQSAGRSIRLAGQPTA